MNLRGAGQRSSAWLEERLGLSAAVDFLRHKQIPRNRHTAWMYTGSVILLFLGIQIVFPVRDIQHRYKCKIHLFI